jgi:hypothetical protein
MLPVLFFLVFMFCSVQAHGHDTGPLLAEQESILPTRQNDNCRCNLPKDVPLRTATRLPTVKAPRSGGTSTNYRAEFLKTYPEYSPFASELIIHHAVPPMVADAKGKLFTLDEINSIVNLRGICLSDQASIHMPIMSGWVKFLYTHPQATRKDILDEAARIDATWGSKFYPAIGITPSQK